MAALGGVERCSGAAPRQPALVNARDELLHARGGTQAKPANRASVHRHTRKDTKWRRVLTERMGHRAPRKAVEQSIGLAS